MALETTTREALPLTSQARPLDRYLEVEGLRLRYWDKGEGPPLLLIHGFGACCEYWQNNFTALAQHFRTIALDLPGHGTPKRASPITPYHLRLISWLRFSMLCMWRKRVWWASPWVEH